jgi:NAD(P)-dependent dehydrogenase (short-subunit alcohol dehydrogenase family)
VLNETIGALGKVDILVNSAGRTKRAPTIDFSEADWDAIIDTNLTGTLRACQVFGKHMLERESGSIINIASLSTFVALYEVAAYSASKAAVGSLTKSLAVEWSSHGVRVNAIAPVSFAPHSIRSYSTRLNADASSWCARRCAASGTLTSWRAPQSSSHRMRRVL